MPDRLLGVIRHQTLQLRFGLFMFEVGRTGPREHRGKLHPEIRRAHIDSIRARPAGVFGPVERPPWKRQRFLPSSSLTKQVPRALVFAPRWSRKQL